MSYAAVKSARVYRKIYIHQDYVGPLPCRRGASLHGRHPTWPLWATLAVHGLLVWNLLRAPVLVEQDGHTGRPAIAVTWLAAVPSWAEPSPPQAAEPATPEAAPPPPALVIQAEPPPTRPAAASPVFHNLVPPRERLADVDPITSEMAATEPVGSPSLALSARAESRGPADSNYWLAVRAEITRCLRWPPGPRRSATVEVQLTLDERGALRHVEAQSPPGEERFARGVEQAVRRAAPFAAPDAWSRSARLPVRFVVENRTER